MRRNRPNSSRPAQKIRSLIVGILALAAIGLSVQSTLGYLGGVFIKHLDYFRIKDVLVSGNSTVDLSYLKGNDIFSLDIKKEARLLLQEYPTFKKIKVVKVFPNRIFVEFVKRAPVAYLRLYRYFCVDEEAMLFGCPQDLTRDDLPVIVGLEAKIFGPKPGKKYNLRELTLALEIIGEFKKSQTLKNYALKKINPAQTENVSLFLLDKRQQPAAQGQEEFLEVKVNDERLKEGFLVLGTLLRENKNNTLTIKYIDLRFKEPVIKYK